MSESTYTVNRYFWFRTPRCWGSELFCLSPGDWLYADDPDLVDPLHYVQVSPRTGECTVLNALVLDGLMALYVPAGALMRLFRGYVTVTRI